MVKSVTGVNEWWRGERMTKRIVIWGTGFVGKMVIAEVVKHPMFELVGVGVSNPAKVGRDVGEICGLDGPLGLAATDDVDALIALAPDALVHYGPTAAHADDNVALISRFLRAGIDVCSTAMTPWVWPTMHLNPPNWTAPITEACLAGKSSCFTTGIDPGFANDLFPMTLMGVCAEVRKVRASELLDYTNYEGDYENEMGIGRAPEHRPLLENRDILIFAWGATVPMIAHAAGITLDEITTTWDKWVTTTERKTAKGIIQPGQVAAVRFTINGLYKGETRIQLEHVNRIGNDAAPDWPSGTENDVYRVDIEGTPSIFQETAFRFTDGSGRDAATAGCLATGMRALNAVPAVNALPPGWVTALDLPLIAGAGSIR
jgi:2,4-diaminopentanoate dehydrogenase